MKSRGEAGERRRAGGKVRSREREEVVNGCEEGEVEGKAGREEGRQAYRKKRSRRGDGRGGRKG